MSVNRILEKEWIELLENLENCIVYCDASPQENASNLKLHLLKLYSFLENDYLLKSPLLDFLLSNKNTIFKTVSKLFRFNEDVNFFIFWVVDLFRQNSISSFFNHPSDDCAIASYTKNIEKLKATLHILREDESKQFPILKYRAVLENKSSIFVSDLINSLSKELDIFSFFIDGKKTNNFKLYDDLYFFVEIETNCSLQWVEQKYDQLEWSVLESCKDESIVFYDDFLNSISLYENFIKSRVGDAFLKKQFYEFLTEKEALYKEKYSFSLANISNSFLGISSAQNLSLIDLPTLYEKELYFFLDCVLVDPNLKKNLSFIRIDGESLLYFLSDSHFDKKSESEFIGCDGLVEIFSESESSDLNDSVFSLEYDSLYCDVIIFKIAGESYILPKYQVQSVHTYSDDLYFENKQGVPYYFKDHSAEIVFNSIEWSISSLGIGCNNTKISSSEDKKVIFIEHAGLIFGIVCEFISETTFARKLSSKTSVPSLAAFWKTKEGELIGEFTPLKRKLNGIDGTIKYLPSRSPYFSEVSFIGVFKESIIAIEKNIQFAIENISLSNIYELTSQGEDCTQFYLTFKNRVFSVLNLDDSFKSKDLERGHFVLFCYPSKCFALYFSSIRYDVSSLYLDGNVVTFWDQVVVAESISQNGKKLNVLLEENFNYLK